MRLELFHFRYRDPLTGKWVRARYVAERHVIAERYAEYEIIGEPEIREVDPDARYFNPAGAERRTAAIGNVGAIIAVVRSGGGERRRVAVAGVALWAASGIIHFV
jgi:hypothetical protein